MSNLKSILTRRAIEWEKFLESIIQAREENGEIRLKKPELERIILHHLLITTLREDMIQLQINDREKKWMEG